MKCVNYLNRYFFSLKYNYIYDSLGRIESKRLISNNSFDTIYTYNKTRIISEKFYNDHIVNYSYDNMGNINGISSLNRNVIYEYDKLGRLTKHNCGDYVEDFMYSSNGDVSRIDYDDGNEIVYGFSYDTNRRLTSVSKNNQNYRTFTYPTNNFYPNNIKYYNDNGTTRKQWGLTWQGKRLTRLDYLGVGIIDYEYDESGIMTSRLKLGEHTFFTLEGSNVISLKKVSTSGSYDPIILDFTYDSFNMLAGITYNNKEYFYVRDILGNIYGIINSSGNYIIKYDYNAYGEVTKNIIASSGDDLVVANNNPFMYKGYYYDEDLECYYLKSRFYMPSICRFISPDDHSYLDYEDLRGINLYCYCYDNPVMYLDRDGHFWDTVFDVLFICWDIYDLCKNEGHKDWKKWLALGADIAFAVFPFIAGGGNQVVKLADVADDLQNLSKVTVVGETMNRVETVSQFVNATDNLYDGFKAYNRLSDLGKDGKVLAEVGGKGSNVLWLYGKLRSGYKVIDIGIDSTRIARSSSYIAERITMAVWKSRNIWKWIYHLDF